MSAPSLWVSIVRTVRCAAAALVLFAAGACSNSPYPPGDAQKKVLYASLAEDPRQGLDPVAVTDTVSAGLVGQLYESLYDYHYLKRPYELVPALAAAMPAMSEDGLVMTIPIKSGIHFIDDPCFPGGQGREVVAADFVYALKRMADVNSGSHNYWLIEGKIEGLDGFHAASMELARQSELDADSFRRALAELYDQEVPGLSAPERYTLVIRLVEPFPQLKYVLAMCNCAAQAREAVEYYGCNPRLGRNEYFRRPVGTGPFKLKEWSEQVRIVLERNPGYREEYYPSEGEPGDAELGLLAAAGKRLPFVDEVHYAIIREAQPNWIYFRQGYLDASGIPRDNFGEAVTTDLELAPEFRQRGIRLVREEEMALFWKMFNMSDPLVGDGTRTADGGYALDADARVRNRKLRQAISLALDRDRIIRVFLNGRGIRAKGPLPKGMFGYDRQPDSPYTAYNPQRARQLLAEAGYPEGRMPDGTRLRIVYDLQSNAPILTQMARSLVNDLAAIGIEVEVRANTWAEYLRRTREGRFQLADSGWNLDYPDPENFLQLLYGPNRTPKSNHANYWNAEYDALYERMRNMPDTPERLDIIERMVAIVQEDCPWIFDYSRVSFILVPPWRLNFKPHNISGGYARYADIDVELRNRLRAEWNRPRYAPLAVAGAVVVVGAVILSRFRAREGRN